MTFRNKRIALFFILSLLSISLHGQNGEMRTPFTIPLTKLSILRDSQKTPFKQIRVPLNHGKEYAIITDSNDVHVKLTRMGEEKTVYAEASGSRFMLTNFEAQLFKDVLQSLIQTLELFERDLEKERWDRCLYLDSYFPKFLKEFSYLCCTILSTEEALPLEANISNNFFDISLHSEKTDSRINHWRANRYIYARLCIATRELTSNLKNWVQKELGEISAHQIVEFDENVKGSYRLFIKMYFNI